jgi:hypothetical protein
MGVFPQVEKLMHFSMGINNFLYQSGGPTTVIKYYYFTDGALKFTKRNAKSTTITDLNYRYNDVNSFYHL